MLNIFLANESIQDVSPFRQKSDTQKIVVPAGSAPCTMQFAFTNNYSTLLQKVRLGYTIRVIPPSVETLQLGRSKRAISALNFLESEIVSQRESVQEFTSRVDELDREATRLSLEITEMEEKIEKIQAEEERLKKLIPPEKTETQSPGKRIRGNDGSKYFNKMSEDYK